MDHDVTLVPAGELPWESFEVEDDGADVPDAVIATVFSEDGVEAGVWHSPVGSFGYVAHEDSTLYIVSGVVEVRPATGGDLLHAGPGDFIRLGRESKFVFAILEAAVITFTLVA